MSVNHKFTNFIVTIVLCVTVGSLGSDDSLPLTGARALQFDTQEVTWLSLDVAPDGTTLVFDALGDLYELPINGGEATQLTAGMAFDSQPVYSPDGSKIAFVSDRRGKEDIWLMDRDGSNLRALSDSTNDALFASPSWSPTGDHVVASRTSWGLSTFELWAYSTLGGKGIAITRANRNGSTARSARHNAIGGVYSPDGRYLYYARKFGGFGYNISFPQWQIIRRELRTGFEDQVTGSSSGAFKPKISHNGEYLVYGTRQSGITGLRIRNLKTGSDVVLAQTVQRDEQESRYTRDLLPNYAFTPDDETVIYTYQGKVWQQSIFEAFDRAPLQPEEIPFSLSINQTVGPQLYFPYPLGVGPVKVRLVRFLEMSPDNKRFVFSAMSRLHVYEIESQSIWEVDTKGQYATYPTWSPDGSKLAFVTWDGVTGQVWTVPATAGQPPEVVSRYAAYYSQPLWSKSGESIYVFRGLSHERQIAGSDFGHPPGTDIIEISLQERNKQGRVVRPARGLVNHHWGTESDRLYAYLYPGIFRSGDSGLVSFRLDGSDFRYHVIVKGPGIYYDENDVPASSLELSPNGKHVAVQHANQLYILNLIDIPLKSIESSIKESKFPQVPLTEVGVDYFGWSSDSRIIYWSVGNQLYYRYLNTIKSAVDCVFIDGSVDHDCDPTSPTKKVKNSLLEEHEAVHRLAIDIYHARHEPEGVVALIGGTVISMSSTQPEVLNDATIVIDGDRIIAVGQEIEVPREATRFDITGTYVLPGYVDTHAHVAMYREVLDPRMWSLPANLAYGVTTAIDVQPSTIDVIEYSDLLEAGKIVGPRLLSTGPGVFSNHRFKSKEHAEKILKRYADSYAVHNIKAYLIGNREQRQWLLQASQNLEIMPTAEGGLDTKLVLTHAIDGFSGNEHNIPVVGVYNDVVQLMAQSEIAYTPTLLVNYGGPQAEGYFLTRESPLEDAKVRRYIPPSLLDSKFRRTRWVHEQEYVYKFHAQQAYKIMQAGGKVGVGSHGQVQGLGFHWELWSLASGGFSNYEALMSGTRMGAEMIGVAQDIGTIEPGKLADLVILEHDPMADIRASDDLLYVVRGGVIRETDNLQQVWPVQTR